MARKRNSERFGIPDTNIPEDDMSSAASVAAAGGSSGDIFSFVTPTEFVDLPSQGVFYPEGHPLADIDSLEIRHMTAKEEDILTSESFLKKGIAVDRLLQSVIVNKAVNLDDLLIGDKNALIIATRITGFGPHYATTVTCPVCKETNETVFNLSELASNDTSHTPEGVETNEDGNFTFMLPRSGVEVEVKLLTSKDERILAQTTEKKKKLKLPDTRSTDLLKLVTVSVNGRTDDESLTTFIEHIPLPDVKYLRKVYEQIKPDIDITYDFECDHCSHEGEVRMPLTAQFFWPNT
jgi:hypothetical protein